jgi:hypothetical protein
MSDHKFPLARVENIVSRQVQDELIIYDKARDVATCLNSFAADVWGRCDGRSSPAAIAQALSQSRPEPVDERAVWLAVNRLSRARLLEEPIKIPPSVPGGANRRELLRTLSLGAAAAVPVVISVNAATATALISCKALGVPCSVDADCCQAPSPTVCRSGICSSN